MALLKSFAKKKESENKVMRESVPLTARRYQIIFGQLILRKELLNRKLLQSASKKERMYIFYTYFQK